MTEGEVGNTYRYLNLTEPSARPTTTSATATSSRELGTSRVGTTTTSNSTVGPGRAITKGGAHSTNNKLKLSVEQRKLSGSAAAVWGRSWSTPQGFVPHDGYLPPAFEGYRQPPQSQLTEGLHISPTAYHSFSHPLQATGTSVHGDQVASPISRLVESGTRFIRPPAPPGWPVHSAADVQAPQLQHRTRSGGLEHLTVSTIQTEGSVTTLLVDVATDTE